MPSLAQCCYRNQWIFSRPTLGVVRVVSIQVSCTVHEPCEMEHNDVSESTCNPESYPEIFAPRLSYKSWEYEAHEKRKPRIQFFLEHYSPIFF
mmetsp:Transcript_27758/g.36385  ORF Transcript_27758/g.36385 Transcript_27758/m.36385 type:complete len:93 (+) Transcript_27758:352-630(+)